MATRYPVSAPRVGDNFSQGDSDLRGAGGASMNEHPSDHHDSLLPDTERGSDDSGNATSGARAAVTRAPFSSSAGGSDDPGAKQCPSCLGRFPVSFKVCPHDASELGDAPELEDEVVGQILGGTYEIVRVIGEGGMGRVYEAKHTRLPNKRFALKLLHPELARQAEVMARFQREAEAASVLTHPNVVSVLDVDRAADGTPYIVAELLEGEQLGEHLDRMGRLAPGRAVAIVRQICRALQVAHERGIVHRDMKPENVFLAGEERQVKVLDFGISKVGDENSSLTRTGMVMGTPDYMPPEQAKGQRVDRRADIYAVGAILYRALTGRKPFDESDQMATLTAVLVQEPTRPRTLNAAIPPGLEVVVQRAMAKEPGERYQTMLELDQDLAAFDDGSLERNVTALGHGSASDGERVSWIAGVVRLAQSAGVAQGAKFSRPMVVVLSVTATLWVFAGLCDMAQATILLLGSEPKLTTVETWAILIGVAGVLITPLVLWYRHIAFKVWASTPRSMDLAERLWGAVTLSAAVYGFGAIGVRLYHGVYLREPEGTAWAGYAIVLYLVAALVGLSTWFGARMKGALFKR
ncbi:MAG TPA: serine/threonine-protein kinase [Polyangiaceae bacterium]|nr:serine/threonine-protein kinase [Polyangiaceae bacterium]